MNLAVLDHLLAANLVLMITDIWVAFAVSGLTVAGMIARNPSRRQIKIIVLCGLGLWTLSFFLASIYGWSPLYTMSNWAPFCGLPLHWWWW